MDRIVWKNKSNGQLCVTIPKNSGVNEGDIISLQKKTVKRLVYSVATGDLFHYGHLRLLENAGKLGELHVCGVLTNEAIMDYKSEPVADFNERKAIISSLRCVDMVVTQTNIDPTKNLELLHKQFPSAKITLVFGSNWEDVPGASFVESIGGEVHQPPFYDKLASNRVLEKVSRIHKKASSKKQVYVNMCADMIHHGHINILEKARELGEVTVGLMTDDAIRNYKRNPLLNYDQRKMIIENIVGVKQVIPQHSLDYEPNLKSLKPDYVVHGTDWREGVQKTARDKVLKIISKWGGKIIEPEYTKDISSTKLINAVLEEKE